jgi:hypothetical protein
LIVPIFNEKLLIQRKEFSIADNLIPYRSCQNLQPAQIADYNRISKNKNPKSIPEMGLYNSTMALSTGFTVG